MPAPLKGKVSGLDPRNPLVLDVRELGRRAGAMSNLTRTVPAPPDLGVAVIGVPEGSDLELAVRLESVIDGVLLTGTARVHVEGECSRCLDPVSASQDIEFQELFLYPTTDSRGRLTHEEQPDEELPTLEDDLLDLEPTLRDAVVLALPIAPVCRVDCPGLCPQCGFRLAEDLEHQHDQVDPRWAALQAMLTGDATETNAGSPADQEEG